MEEKIPKLNKLCRTCIRNCKQPQEVVLLSCPRYQQRPFAAQELSFSQLELFNDKAMSVDSVEKIP